jgi:hypothetical protein
MDTIESQIKRLLTGRSSETLATSWTRHFPSISPTGEKPNMKVEAVAGFDAIAIQLREKATEHAKEFYKEQSEKPNKREKYVPPPITELTVVKGIRSIVFWEGVFLLHKALHVVSCAELGAKRGIKTWSLCEAYQGALFGAKAICHLLGVAFPEHDGKTIMLDVWPDDPTKKSKTSISIEEELPVQFTRWPFQFQHQHIWRVFQRLMRVSRILTWPNEYTRSLANLEHSQFAYQRNQIQYTNKEWIFNDLHAPDGDTTFGDHPTGLSEALEYQMESDFSVALSLAVIRLGYLLVEEITQNTKVLDDEKDLIRGQFTPEKHPLYLSAHP